MSTNPLELFPDYENPNKPVESKKCVLERRKRVRTNLHWTVLLRPSQGADAIETLTKDLSSEGFYCLSRTLLTPGEILNCKLKVPTHDPSGKQVEQYLECKVQVLRVERQKDETQFGVACRIEDYHFADTFISRRQNGYQP